MGPYVIYPNFYTILVAPSGRFRKSSSIRMASEIIKMVIPKPNLISQKITPEALIEAMKYEKNEENKVCVSSSTAFAVVDELASFLNKKSYEAGLASLLIDFYDCPADWEYRTKARSVERLEQPCLGLLSASTVDWIRDCIPAEAVGGGLTSRCIFVYVETPPPPVARTTYSDEQRQIKEKLVRQLQEISRFEGSVSLTTEAWAFYEVEYLSFHGGAKDLWEDKFLTGYAARRHVHWLKLAMIFAAAENSLIITLQCLKGALKMLTNAEIHMKMVMSLITSSEMGGNISRVQLFIKQNGRVTKMQLVRGMMNYLSSRQLGDIIDSLSAAGLISVSLQGKTICYSYVKEN